MDVIGAQADDEEQDFIRSVCEKEILSKFFCSFKIEQMAPILSSK